MPSLILFLPLAGVLLLNVPNRHNVRGTSFYAVLAIVLFQIGVILGGGMEYKEGIPGLLTDYFQLGLELDGLSMLTLLTQAMVVFCSLFVGRFYFGNEPKLFTFHALLLLSLVGMNGVAMTRDIFSLYLFVEITTIASFIMIALNRDILGFEGCFKYAIMANIATLLMLVSIAFLLMITGETSFAAIRTALSLSPDSKLVHFVLGVYLIGLFLKSGLIPFHGWVPDAYMAAPAPVSVMFGGIITKATGVYSLMRLITSVFGFSVPVKTILLVVGAVSIVFGALLAMKQRDFKRMLAYSSVSQIGYILMGFGTGTQLGFAGALFHFFNHAVLKTSLFTNSAAIEKQAGTRDLKELNGVGSRMPVTSVTSVIAGLSTAGIPPLSGFWSKLVILIALWKEGYYGFVVVGALASLLTLAYFLGFQKNVFFSKTSDSFNTLQEAEWHLVFPAVLMCVVTIGLGVFFPYVVGSIFLPVSGIL